MPDKVWSGLPYTGPRDDAKERKRLAKKLGLPRGDYDIKAEKRRAAAYDMGLVSPPPRDKDGKASYIPDKVYKDKDIVPSHNVKMQSKAALQFMRRGKSFADYAAGDDSRLKALRLAVLEGRISPDQFDRMLAELCGDIPRDPVSVKVFATPRPDSPFKRKRAAPVVVVKTGRG